MAQRKLDRLHDDELYADRRHRIQHEIHDEWIELGSKQETFDLIAEIVQNNSRLRRTGGHVLDWMYFNYVAAIAMTLRRELDHQKTVNLRHLLHEMEERPQVVTRGRYRSLWPEGGRRDRVWGPDRDFERHQKVDAFRRNATISPKAVRLRALRSRRLRSVERRASHSVWRSP